MGHFQNCNFNVAFFFWELLLRETFFFFHLCIQSRVIIQIFYYLETHLWSIVDDSGEKPDGRDGHSATVIRDSMYLFGGFVQRVKRFSNDIYEFNFLTATWTLIVPKSAVRPFWRDFHTATAIGETLYIFGGRMDLGRTRFTGENFYSNDLYAFNVLTKKWAELRADTSTQSNYLQILGDQADIAHTFSPCGRRSHSACAYNNRMLIFGGFQENIQKHFNDMYEYDVARNEWRMVEQQGLIPCARRRHSCNLVGSRMLIFGGTGPCEVPLTPPLAAEANTEQSLATTSQGQPLASIEYDALLARLQRNFNYVQNASRERNLLDLNELNHSLEVARARILAPLQQLMNEHEHERLILEQEELNLLAAENNEPNNPNNNNYNNIINRYRTFSSLTKIFEKKKTKYLILRRVVLDRIERIDEVEEPIEEEAAAGNDLDHLIADLNALNEMVVRMDERNAGGGAGARAVADQENNNELALIDVDSDEGNDDIAEFDEDSGSDDMINDEGDDIASEDDDDDNMDEDFNLGLLSLSDLHVCELDGKCEA